MTVASEARRYFRFPMIVTHEIRVRYGETDQMGVVHHSVYPLYFEEARTEFMRALGVRYAELERRGVLLPLVEFQVRFRRGPHYDDRIRIECRLSRMTRVTMRLDYRTYDAETGHLLAEGFTAHAVTDRKFKPRRLPKDVDEALRGAIRPEWEDPGGPGRRK